MTWHTLIASTMVVCRDDFSTPEQLVFFALCICTSGLTVVSLCNLYLHQVILHYITLQYLHVPNPTYYWAGGVCTGLTQYQRYVYPIMPCACAHNVGWVCLMETTRVFLLRKVKELLTLTLTQSSKMPSSLIAIFGCFGSQVIHGIHIVFHSRCVLSFHSNVNDGIHVRTSVLEQQCSSCFAHACMPPPHDHAYATGNTNTHAQCTEISIPKCDGHTYIPTQQDM